MTDKTIHTANAAPATVRALPDGTKLVLDQHPDKPTFALNTDPLDGFLVLELSVAREQGQVAEAMALMFELLESAFAPGEWARFRKAMREVPAQYVDESGVTVVVDKTTLLRSIYEELFPLYTDRPTTPSST